MGLTPTGIPDDALLKEVRQSRCGNQDVTRKSDRRKRFGRFWFDPLNEWFLDLVFISQWENKVRNNILKLKWYLQNYTKDIPRADIKYVEISNSLSL